jgi:peptide/nickel transport system permease protein
LAKFLVRRLVAIVPLLLLVSLAVFSLQYLVPGDAARTLAGGEYASAERVQQVRQQLGLDDPFVVQYARWLGGALRLDFGKSLFSGRSVISELGRRLPVTASLVLGSVVLAVIIALVAGTAAAIRAGGFLDRAITAGVSVGIAVPSFWLGLMLVVVFSVQLGWFPAVGYVKFTDSPAEWARHLVLPWIAIAVGMSASLTRQLRAGLADVLKADYIRTARSKGLSQRRLVGKHALKNAAMPAITVLGLQVGYLFGGAVIVEQVFGIPGIGTMMINAVSNRDIPVIQGGVMVMALLVVLTNLFVDLAYGYVNPKVRVS